MKIFKNIIMIVQLKFNEDDEILVHRDSSDRGNRMHTSTKERGESSRGERFLL